LILNNFFKPAVQLMVFDAHRNVAAATALLSANGIAVACG
jgi:hypothetical protein